MFSAVQNSTDPWSKNRVVGSSSLLAACAWSFDSEAVDLYQESGSISTTTVSGVWYWLSKDPIGIRGGTAGSSLAGTPRKVAGLRAPPRPGAA